MPILKSCRRVGVAQGGKAPQSGALLAIGSGAGSGVIPAAGGGVEVHPGVVEEVKTREEVLPDHGYVVICWNDPINIMDYVTLIFQRVFGWARPKAEKHMLEVHHQGRSVLVQESREKAEHYVRLLQSFQLTATMEKVS